VLFLSLADSHWTAVMCNSLLVQTHTLGCCYG